ncbi:MAG: hypothetical protein M1840_006743 [Geoglossum simile]|nr:MAG: hypothetical protein M1840_006743 [Geoglossum simile]
MGYSQGTAVGSDYSPKSLLWTPRSDHPSDSSAEARQLWSAATETSTHLHSYATRTGMMPSALRGENVKLKGLSALENHCGWTTATTDFKGRDELESDEVTAGKSNLDSQWIEDMEPGGFTVCSRRGTDKWVVISSPVANEQGEHGTNGVPNETDVEKMDSGERRQCKEDELPREGSTSPSRDDMNTESPGGPQQDLHTSHDKLDDRRDSGPPLLGGKSTAGTPRSRSPGDRNSPPREPDEEVALDARLVRKLGQIWRLGDESLSMRVRLAEKRRELGNQRSALRDSIAKIVRALGEGFAKAGARELGGFGDLTNLYDAVLEHSAVVGPLEELYDDFEDQVDQADYRLRKLENAFYANICERFGNAGVSLGVPVPAIGDVEDDSSDSSGSDDRPELHPLKHAYLSMVGDANIARERLGNLEHNYWRVLEEQNFRKSHGLESKENTNFLEAYPSDRAQLETEIRGLDVVVEELRRKCVEIGVIEQGPLQILAPPPLLPPPPPPLPSQLSTLPPPPQPWQQPPPPQVWQWPPPPQPWQQPPPPQPWQQPPPSQPWQRPPPPQAWQQPPPLPPWQQPRPPQPWQQPRPPPPPPPPLLPRPPPPPPPPPLPFPLPHLQPPPPLPQPWEQSQLQQSQPQPQQLQEVEPVHMLPRTPKTLPAMILDGHKPPSQLPQSPRQSSQYGDHLITSFSSTRDRVNRWLLDILRHSPIEKRYYRSFLSKNPAISNLQWESLFALLVKYWPTDSAAIGDPISPVRSPTASRKSSVASDDNTTTEQQYSTLYAPPGGAAGTETIHRSMHSPMLIFDTSPLQLAGERMAPPSLTDGAGGGFASPRFSPRRTPPMLNGKGVYVNPSMEEDLDLLERLELDHSRTHYGKNSYSLGIHPSSPDGIPGATEGLLYSPEFSQQWGPSHLSHEQFSPWSSPTSGKTSNTW